MSYESTLRLVVTESSEIEQLSSPLFGGLTRAQLSQIGALLSKESLVFGEVVFSEGDLPDNIYIVTAGEIELRVKNREGHRCVERYAVGDSLGETAVLGIQAQVGTAVVSSSEGAEVLALTRAALAKIQTQDKDAFAMLILNVARNLSRKHHDELSLCH